MLFLFVLVLLVDGFCFKVVETIDCFVHLDLLCDLLCGRYLCFYSLLALDCGFGLFDLCLGYAPSV